MRNLKKTTNWSVVFFLLLAACYNNDGIKPSSGEFVAGKLATVLVAKDYEVNFWELSPGNIAVDVYRSIDADMQYPGLIETLRGNNYVEMYKQLTGENADITSIKKLESAELRYQNLPVKLLAQPAKDFFLTSSFDHKYDKPNGRVQAACSTGSTWSQKFKEKYCTEPWWGCDLNIPPPYNKVVDSTPNQTWSINIMNGQSSTSGNVIFVSHPGFSAGIVNPWTIRTVTLRRNTEGILSYSFTNGLKCPSTHFAYHLINL